MSDFINQLPPSFREALEQQKMPEMSDEEKARLLDRIFRERPEKDEEFTKTKREE